MTILPKTQSKWDRSLGTLMQYISVISIFAVSLFLESIRAQAPATLTQSVTYNGETITMQLTKESLRGSNFELWSQNSSGGYDAVTPVGERSYIGTVDEYPGAVSCGVRLDNGTFKGAVYFDRGVTWFTQGTSVVGTRALNYGTFSAFQAPSAPTVSAGQAGSTTYGFELGIDADYNYYTNAGSSVATALEGIEYSVCVVRAIYMRDVLLRPYLGRVIVRTTLAHDPYTGLNQGDYLSAVRTEWNSNQTSTDPDLVAGVSPTKIGGGLAWVGVVDTSSGYSVNQSGGNGNFDVVFRHEMGHNWNCGHFVGGSPEGAGLMGGNQPGRFSGCEAYRVLNHRNAKISSLDNEGTFTAVELPPYASMDYLEGNQLATVTFADVLANDHDANGQTISLTSFQSVSANGGGITQQGQALVYTPPANYSGTDYFTYTITDSAGKTATGVAIVKVEPLVHSPVPAHAGTNVAASTQDLSWSTRNALASYDVYFGTNQNAVATATRASVEYLGEATTTTHGLAAPLTLGVTYFWRIDAKVGSDVVKGEVWRFDTVPWVPGDAVVLKNWTQEPGVTASQSTTSSGGNASRAIDGNTDGSWYSNSVTHTDPADSNSWWEVDLGADRVIGSVSLHNRTDCCSGRLSNFRVSILDASRVEVAGQDYYQGSGSVGTSELWTLASAVTGRYVRIQLNGSNNEGNGVISLAEVVVNESPENVALNTGLTNWARESGATASQSTTSSGGDASRAIDGNTNGNWAGNSVTHTDPTDNNSWWEVDLGVDREIGLVNLHNRTDCCSGRLSNFRVSVLDAARSELSGQNFYQGSGAVGISEAWQLSARVVGRYVRVELLGQNNEGNGVLSLAEVEVFRGSDPSDPVATQSTTDYDGVASRAIDGNTDGAYTNNSVTHTDSTSNNWWEVNLQGLHSLEQIVLYNRDSNQNRLSNFRVSVWNGSTEVLGGNYFIDPGTNAGAIFSLSSLDGIVADRVRIELLGTNSAGDKVLSLAEVQVHGTAIVNSPPVASDATFAVGENSTVGTAVGSVTASDPDAGDTLAYAITSGNTGNVFAIDSGTGAITTAAALDYEVAASYVLTVTVTDDGSPSESDTAAVTVNVTNVNEAPSAGDISGSVAEDVPTGTSVATVTATDPDAGDTLSYAITAGNTGGAFAIDSSGNITTATTLDFETTSSYSLTVTVTDSGSLTDTATVNISVTDVVEVTGPKLVRTTVSNVSNAGWTNVDLGQSYNSAVIIATPIYPNSTIAPVVTRIRNVSGSGFEVKIDRTDGLTGTVNVDVSIVAVEEGVYTQATDGVTMEAVKYTSTITGAKNAWTAEARTYQNSYTNPVVVGQVMSANDADWSTFWCHGSSRTNPPNASNLNVGKQVAEDPDTTRADETVGYIVIESGNGTINGVNYAAGVGSDIVRGTGNTGVGYNYSLSGLSSASAAAASIAGLDGGDGGWAVLYGLTPMSATTLTVAVDEDQLSNSERNHTTEQVGYLVLE